MEGNEQINNSKHIKIGAILSYLAIGFNIISGLWYTPWMVETIGKSQYGLFTLAQSLITMFIVDFGLSSATGRYLSKYNAEGDKEGAERFLGAVYKLYLLIDAVILAVLVVLFFFLDRLYVKLTPEELEQFKVVYVISGLFAVINFPCVTFKGILTAYEKFIPLKVADLLYRLLIIVFTVAALLLGYGLYALVTVHAVVGLLVLVFKYLVIRKTVPVKVNFQAAPKGIYKDIFGFSLWVTLSSLAMRLVFNITPTVLGIVASTAAIAVFGVVTTIEGYTYTITTAINGMFMPKISRIVAGENAEENLNPLFLTVGKFQFALNGLIVAGFAAVGRSFIQLWMGQAYTEAYFGILLVIAPGLFYNALQIANTTLVVMKKVKETAIISVITGVINVALSFPLSYFFGVTGACISICVAYMIRNVLCNILSHKLLPLDVPRFIKECYFRMSLPILLTVGCGVVINYFIADSGWLIFFAKAAAVAAIYLVSLFFVGLTQQERKNILQWIGPRLAGKSI